MTVPDLSFEVALSPTFHDCDPMHVVWHGNYFKYFEVARCALLDKLGHNYTQMRAAGYAWPIIDLQALTRETLAELTPWVLKQGLELLGGGGYGDVLGELAGGLEAGGLGGGVVWGGWVGGGVLTRVGGRVSCPLSWGGWGQGRPPGRRRRR